MRTSVFLLLLNATAAAVGSGPISVDLSTSPNTAAASVVAPTVTVSTLPLSLSPWGWWDFSDITTLYQDNVATVPVTADSNRVAYAADKSGNTRHATQATNGNRLTYRTGIQNGHSACTCAEDTNVDNLSTAVTIANDDITILAAIRTPATITGATTYGICGALHSTSGGANLTIESTASKLAGRVSPTDGSILDATAAGTSLNKILCLQVRASSPKRRFCINGAEIGTSDTAVTTVSNIVRMGSAFANNNNAFFTGHLMEVLVFVPCLSDANATLMMAWLAAKWSIS